MGDVGSAGILRFPEKIPVMRAVRTDNLYLERSYGKHAHNAKREGLRPVAQILLKLARCRTRSLPAPRS